MPDLLIILHVRVPKRHLKLHEIDNIRRECVQNCHGPGVSLKFPRV